MKLIRLFDPSRVHENQKMKIHYQALDGNTLLCGLGNVWREADGERFAIWRPTKRPVTCLSCTRRIEALVRLQANGLTAGQYEDLLAHIESFRASGNGTTEET